METALATYTQTAGFRAVELMIYNDSYKYAIKPFAQFLDGDDVSVDGIRDYFRHLNTTDLSASTIRVRRQAVKDRVRRKFAYASPKERDTMETAFREMDRDPDLKCPGTVVSGVGTDKVLSEQEYTTVLMKCRSRRQRLFIEALYTTGARISELTGITRADCKSDGTVVTLRLKGKGNRNASFKERHVFMAQSLYNRIRDEFRGEIYLFETSGGKRYSRSYVSNQISKITMHAIGRRLSAHKLRHSFATHQIKKHGRLKAVSQYLGHSDISITARFYDHDQLSATDVLGADAVCT